MNKNKAKHQIDKIITILDNTEGLGKEEYTELKWLLEYCKHLVEKK